VAGGPRPGLRRDQGLPGPTATPNPCPAWPSRLARPLPAPPREEAGARETAPLAPPARAVFGVTPLPRAFPSPRPSDEPCAPVPTAGASTRGRPNPPKVLRRREMFPEGPGAKRSATLRRLVTSAEPAALPRQVAQGVPVAGVEGAGAGKGRPFAIRSVRGGNAIDCMADGVPSPQSTSSVGRSRLRQAGHHRLAWFRQPARRPEGTRRPRRPPHARSGHR